MKLRELFEEIKEQELKVLETELDRLFKKYDIDIVFTYHFKERMNDPRNRDPITIDELRKIFTETSNKYGKEIKEISKSKEAFEAVLKDLSTNINIPFVLADDPKNKELDLKSKTIMRKKNFGTPDPTFEI
jgi:hypothetical protein